MKILPLFPVLFASATLAACSSPTGFTEAETAAARAVSGAPAFDGIGMGSGNVVEGGGGGTTTAVASDETTAAGGGTISPCEGDSRGGFGMGSGNYSDICPGQTTP